jgi:hypothetical protein
MITAPKDKANTIQRIVHSSIPGQQRHHYRRAGYSNKGDDEKIIPIDARFGKWKKS